MSDRENLRRQLDDDDIAAQFDHVEASRNVVEIADRVIGLLPDEEHGLLCDAITRLRAALERVGVRVVHPDDRDDR